VSACTIDNPAAFAAIAMLDIVARGIISRISFDLDALDKAKEFRRGCISALLTDGLKFK
jgi:hypothetical protein